jgi:hypothetical protein
MVAIWRSLLAVPTSAQYATGGLPYPFGPYTTGSLPYDILKALRAEQGDTGAFDCKPHVPGSAKEAVDWASILSTPRDQGYCGSCYTFASIAVMEGSAYIDLNKKVELSEMQLVDCAATDVDGLFPGQEFPRPYDDTHPDYHVVGGCAGGWPSVALKHFTQSGVDKNPAKCVCSRSSYEYEGDLKPRCDKPGLEPSTPCYHETGEEYREPVMECRESSCECALPAAVVEDCYEVGVDGQLSAVDALKEALSQRPIAVNIASTPISYPKFAEGYAGVVPADEVKCHQGQKTDHAVVAVGFGKDEQGREYWKIRNSWGADWGEGGYVRVEIVDDQAGSLCMNTNVWVYPKLTSDPDSDEDEPTTVAPVEPTTLEPTTVAPVDPETEEPTTVAPVDPTTQQPTITPTTQEPVPTTEQPTIAPVDPDRCRTCLTFCAPCEACTAGPEGTFAFGSCEKCWKCWDWDDDELEDDDDKMDKDCDALHKDHDWDDEEVRCLHNDFPRRLAGSDGRRRTSPSVTVPDCRACWTELGEMSVFV